MVELALPPKSHNNPPSDVELLGESLILKHVSLIRQAQDYVALADRIPEKLSEQDEANFVTDKIKEIMECQKSLKSAHKEEKEPFLRQGQYVDSFFNDEVKKLTLAIEKANLPLGKFLKEQAAIEQKRRDDEAAVLRQAAQDAMANAVISPSVDTMEQAVISKGVADFAVKVASVPVQTMAVARGTYSTASLKKEWVGTITDIANIDIEKLKPYIKMEALQVALNTYVKMGGRMCTGCTIEETISTKVK